MLNHMHAQWVCLRAKNSVNIKVIINSLTHRESDQAENVTVVQRAGNTDEVIQNAYSKPSVTHCSYLALNVQHEAYASAEWENPHQCVCVRKLLVYYVTFVFSITVLWVLKYTTCVIVYCDVVNVQPHFNTIFNSISRFPFWSLLFVSWKCLFFKTYFEKTILNLFLLTTISC